MSLSDQWSLATGEENGKILIYRIRLQAPSFASAATFPHLLVVFWAFESPNEEGLPAPEDLELMTKLENLLQMALEQARQAFLSVIVTGDGIREWQWYVCDPKSTMELVNNALGNLESFPIRIDFQEDPQWAVYGTFLDLTGSVEGGLGL
jgi:uncharacterized protein DUF695